MKRIFAVDDSASIRLYMEKMLSELGYSVELAVDGESAIEAIRKHSEPVDIFIIDIVMKKMDGFSLIALIREIDMYKSVPVIILTNLDDTSLIEKAKSLGVSCWISKPFEVEQVSRAIESLVK